MRIKAKKFKTRTHIVVTQKMWIFT